MDPSTSVYFGDHPLNGIEPANLVGMVSVWKRDVAWQNIKVQFIIKQLTEIRAYYKEYKMKKHVRTFEERTCFILFNNPTSNSIAGITCWIRFVVVWSIMNYN